MKSENIILIGNLKQNPETLIKSLALVKEYIKLKKINKQIVLGIAIPLPFLSNAIKSFGKSLSIYSQILSGWDGGAHTGDVSATQLSSVGVRNTIIGHSERRTLGENNDTIQKQVTSAIAKKMNIVLCVGETERHVDTGHIKFVDEQIQSALQYIKKSDLKKIVLAYEPVWAIGKNAVRSATENEIYEMTIAIRKKLVELFGKISGTSVDIIYGGSVDSKNCASIISVPHISGFLLGRVSLDPKEIKKIIEIISKKK